MDSGLIRPARSCLNLGGPRERRQDPTAGNTLKSPSLHSYRLPTGREEALQPVESVLTLRKNIPLRLPRSHSCCPAHLA